MPRRFRELALRIGLKLIRLWIAGAVEEIAHLRRRQVGPDREQLEQGTDGAEARSSGVPDYVTSEVTGEIQWLAEWRFDR